MFIGMCFEKVGVRVKLFLMGSGVCCVVNCIC